MIYLLNTPILTDYGVYEFKRISLESIKIHISIAEVKFTSAVGHQGTADLLSNLLGIPVPMNRIAIKMEEGDVALVFRLKNRLPEGTVLSESGLGKLDYEFGLLRRMY